MSRLRVAVAGHRWNRIDPETESAALSDLLQEALRTLAGADGPATLVTGMAEGTDLSAAATRPAHWHLEAVLALPEPGWRTYLASAEGVRPEDRAAYDHLIKKATICVPGSDRCTPDFVALAAYLAATCTTLLTVWDGQPGPPGGTSDVVARVRSRGLPLVNLWPRLAARRHVARARPEP